MIAKKKVAGSRENFGTIPIIRGEEKSEKAQPQVEEENWKEKNVSENRVAILKEVVRHIEWHGHVKNKETIIPFHS